MATVDVYRALWRHRFLIIGLTLVTGIVVWFLASLQPKVYEATALVRIQQKIATAGDAFGSLEVGTRLAQTYARIVETKSIDGRVAVALDGRVRPDNIHLSAKPVVDVELLEISARSRSPVQAALVANTATDALKDFVRDTGTLRDQVIVVDRATVPTSPVSPRVKLMVALAVLLGLILNAALALLAELFADRLPDTSEIEAAFGRPVLAAIPSLSFPKAPTLAVFPAPGRGGLVQAPVIEAKEARQRGR
jgi:polysaccharide biosynthesis transport protein